MPRNITVIIDDQNSDIKYLCPVHSQTVAGTYINNTWTSVNGKNCADNGWFEYTFFGTRVQVAASSSHADKSFSVRIDDGPKTAYTGGGFYESPVLADGRHTITYYAPQGSSGLSTSFDYLTVTAGTSTPVGGRTLIVDDSDDAVDYTGNWSTQPPVALNFDFSTSLYQSTTHWSSSVGDSIAFHFVGDSVAAFGIVANLNKQNISTTYILDGVPTTVGIPAGTIEGLPKAPLFRAQGLSAGEHTLLVNVSNIAAPQAIGFDFFLYNSTTNNLVPTSAAAEQLGSNRKHVRTGAIVGGLIGAFLFIGLVLFAFLQWNKRRKGGKVSGFGATEKFSSPLAQLKKPAAIFKIGQRL